MLFGSDQLGELPDDGRILRVAPEGGLGHLQVLANEELHGRALVGRELHPVEHPLREAQALLRVVRFAPLADVVKEERQREQLRRAHLVQNRAEPVLADRLGVEQRLQSADGEQRVLVDGVLVVEVANHAAVHLLEFRKDAREEPAVVHLRETRVQAAPGTEQHAQLLPLPFGRDEVVNGAVLDVLLDAVQRLLGDGGVLLEREPERLEPERRLRGGAAGVHEADAVARDLELPADTPDREIRGGRRADDALRPGQRPGDRARVAEVFPHERLDAAIGLRSVVAEHLGDLLLELVGHEIDVAARLQVQHRTDAQEKVLGLAQRIRPGRAVLARSSRLQRPQVARRQDVAKAARRLLDVGLELVVGVVETFVPLVDELQQGIDGGRGERAPAQPFHEVLEKALVAGQKADVERREEELGVADVDHVEIGELPHVLSDGQPEIPQRLDDGLDVGLFGARQRALEQQKQIDVRVQAQRAAPVPADRAERDGHGGLLARGRGNGAHHVVHALRVALDRLDPAASQPGRGGVLVPRRREHRCPARLAVPAVVSRGGAGHRAVLGLQTDCHAEPTSTPEGDRAPGVGMFGGSADTQGSEPRLRTPSCRAGVSAQRAAPRLVREREADQRDRLEPVVAVERLQVVAEPQHVDPAVRFERAAFAGDDRHAQLKSGAEEPKGIVARGALVVLVDAQAGLDRNVQRQFLVELDGRADAQLEIRALLRAAIGLPVGQFEGEDYFRRQRKRARAVVNGRRHPPARSPW